MLKITKVFRWHPRVFNYLSSGGTKAAIIISRPMCIVQIHFLVGCHTHTLLHLFHLICRCFSVIYFNHGRLNAIIVAASTMYTCYLYTVFITNHCTARRTIRIPGIYSSLPPSTVKDNSKIRCANLCIISFTS